MPLQGHEINADALQTLQSGSVSYQETLEIYDGEKWWSFTNGKEPVRAKVLVGREGSSFFPFLPDPTHAECIESEAYSNCLVGDNIITIYASQNGSGGVGITVWAYGSMNPLLEVENSLWGSANPFQEITGVYYRNGIYHVLGKRFSETWNGYKYVETSTPAWASYNSSTGTWSYDHLSGESWLTGISFVQQGAISQYENLFCSRLYNGRLWGFEISLSSPDVIWTGIISSGSSSGNVVEWSGVTGKTGIAQSVEKNDALLAYSKSDGWTWTWEYGTGAKDKVWQSGDIPLVGGGVLQTFRGEYLLLATSGHGVQRSSSYSSLPSDFTVLSAGAIDETYARVFYSSGGKLFCFRVNISTGAIDQISGAGVDVSEITDKSFRILYSNGLSEIWMVNNHRRVQFCRVFDGSVVWFWDDWASVLGIEPEGARFIPTDPAHFTGGIWCGDKSVLDVSLVSLAVATSSNDVTIYLSGLSIVDTGFSGSMGQGDPFGILVRTTSGNLLTPYMTWADAGEYFRMDLHVAVFSNSLVFQEEKVKTGVWNYDWDLGYPYPYEWRCSFLPQTFNGFLGICDYSETADYLGLAPIWCDVSPWLKNATGQQSYFQQPDKVYSVAESLSVFSELTFSHSSYPDTCQISPAGLSDGRYRVFTFGARGEIGFWSWAPGDSTNPIIEKSIITGWKSNYSTSAICTYGGTVGMLFKDIFSGKFRVMRSSSYSARVVSQVAKKITTTSYPELNSIDDPVETDDAFQSLYASGQRTWFGLEMGGNHTVRGLGASSVYEIRDFVPYPFQREGIRMNLNSMSKQTKITLPDTQDRAIRNVVSSGLDFRGKRCILRRLFAKGDPLDSGSSINLIDGYIQDWTASSDQGIIVFSIAHSVIDIRGKFPPRTLSLNCGHKFRGTRCMYAGTSGSCDHTKPLCEELNNVIQFGGFPTVSARQRRVLWR